MRNFIICTHPQILIRQIKSRRMRWAGNVARVEEVRKVFRVLAGKPEGKRQLVRPRRRWRMEPEWISGRLAGGPWIGFDWLRIGTGGELL
jgi:hypothetical protein